MKLKRKISKEISKIRSEELKCQHFEVSAKNGQGVKAVFEKLTLKLIGGQGLPNQMEKKFVLG